VAAKGTRKRAPAKKPASDQRVLTPLRARFVEAYIRCRNITEAGRIAGLQGDSPTALGKNASDMFRHPLVQTEIKRRLAALEAETTDTAHRVIEEYARIAFADPADMLGGDGGLLAMQDWPEDIRRAVASYEIVTRELPTPKGEPAQIDYVHKIKFWPKPAALKDMGQYLGIFIERQEVKIDMTIQEAGDDALLEEAADLLKELQAANAA
jgi:phage terminase small subunit